ncbi:MAG: hypothetical protein ACOX6N_05575 [Patescibacteria group bacterium]|jgi:hypothetical protein
MKMTDRLYPGSGINSFLRQNGILKGFGKGEVKRIDEVASVTSEEKSQLINPNVTVPVTSNDIQINTVNGKTPVTLTSDIQDNVGGINRVETYKCPCGGKPSCPCSNNRDEGFMTLNPAKNLKEVWDKFSSTEKKDTFKTGRTPQSTIEFIDKAAETIKSTLTGSDKSDSEKNVIEGFCNENWHTVAMSVVVTIAVVFITISIMIFLSFIKIVEKNCKPNKVKYNTGMSGGVSGSRNYANDNVRVNNNDYNKLEGKLIF